MATTERGLVCVQYCDQYSIAAALTKRLGGFPFWRGGKPFLDAIEGIYTAA
jgi:hypothetical protein